MTTPARQLGAICWLASVSLGLAVVADLGLGAGDRRATADRATALLVEAALVCVAWLARRRVPSLAWVAGVLAVGLASVDVVAAARSADAAGHSALDVVVAEAAKAGAALAAAAYVWARSARPGLARNARRAGVATVIVVALTELLAVALTWNEPAPFEGDAFRIANRVLLGYVAGALVLGVALDVGHAWQEVARRRRAAGLAMPISRRSAAWLLLDELAPGLRLDPRKVIESERARLAADLHAAVLPPLRSALAAAHGGAVADVEIRLAAAVDEVEQLMAGREPVITETLGLIPSLEWLAERVQQRSGIPVELDIEGTDTGRPPMAVERAAFRIAQLALDNAGRHSRATSIRLSVRADGSVGEICVSDDGIGIQGSAPEGRGLHDMRLEAAAVGGSLEFVGPPGTTVRFRWSGTGRSAERD